MFFYRRETFGYSLNGREFFVAQGDSYTVVEDSLCGTHARILDGRNENTVTDRSLRPLVKNVNTGWSAPAPDDTDAASFTHKTDTFVLSLSYEEDIAESIGNGRFGIASRTKDGRWVNAVDLDFGGTKRYVQGAWGPSRSCG